MAATCAVISSVAVAVWVVRLFTFDATTAKPLPAFASAHRLDRGVEHQQVRLSRDAADQRDHLADPLRRIGESLNLGVGAFGLHDPLARCVGRFRDLPADFVGSIPTVAR